MRMNRITYNETVFTPGDTIYVVSAHKETNDSLEFKTFKPYIEEGLNQHGFKTVNSLKAAKMVAVINYGIDTGSTKIVSTPIYGYDSFNQYSLIIPGYPTPGYAMMGMTTVAYEEYNHVLSIEIFDAKSLNSKNIRQLYTSKVISKNLCPFIAPVFPDLVKGLFKGFPAQNGDIQEINVKTNMSCKNY